MLAIPGHSPDSPFRASERPQRRLNLEVRLIHLIHIDTSRFNDLTIAM